MYFFFPETRYRSLEEMDDIFKSSTNVFNSVSNSLKRPYRYDKHGQLRPEFVEEAIRRKSVPEHDNAVPSSENESDKYTNEPKV